MSRFLPIETRGAVALITLDRAGKRNAINDETIEALGSFFSRPPDGVRVAVLAGAGEHFCAGLDLSEHRERDPEAVMHHSRMWHRQLEALQFGRVPVIAVMKGAVIGGGLEIACATHVRVSEPSAFYALPEAQRGIYVGGGASVRVARVLGAGRMVEMMLTGRSYGAEDGYRFGLAHHLVGEGEGFAKALALAETVAANAPLSTYAVMHAVPRIADMSASDGLFTESLMAALVHTGADAKERLTEFLSGRAVKAGADKVAS